MLGLEPKGNVLGFAADPVLPSWLGTLTVDGIPGRWGRTKVVAKGDDKAVKGDDKSADRTARKAKEHEAQKAALTATLKAPADDALKAELRKHAERVARLERIPIIVRLDAQ